MEVWDPKDKPTVLSQIKTFINAHIRGFLTSRYLYYPGKRLYEWFLWACEHYGGEVSVWAWHKRWDERNRHKWKKD